MPSAPAKFGGGHWALLGDPRDRDMIVFGLPVGALSLSRILLAL